jgi:hypothetical protein
LCSQTPAVQYNQLWRTECATPDTPARRAQILAAAREAKRLKKERRETATLTHIHVLLLNKLTNEVEDPRHKDDLIGDFDDQNAIFEQGTGFEDGPETVEEIIQDPGIACMHELLERHRRGNPRAEYGELVMKIGFILLSHNARSYELLSHLFGLSCVSTIWRHYHVQIDILCAQMEELAFLDQALLDYRRQNAIPSADEVHGVLGVDAFSILPSDMSDIPNRSCFLFMFIPFETERKPFPIRLEGYPHGSADLPIQQEIDSLLGLLSERKCVVHFMASDGDSGYSARHREHFLRWFDIYLQNFEHGTLGALEITLNIFATCPNLPILDMLHVAKNFRAKLINHPICLNPSILGWPVLASSLAESLHVGDVLSDTTQMGKMRDSYPILLFTFRNAYHCIVDRKPMESLFILSMAFPLAALRQEGISRDQRLFYAIGGFLILLKFYALSDLPRDNGVTITWRKDTSRGCLLATESMWQRLLNTMFGLCVFIKNSNPSMSGNRFGTHMV